MSAASARAERRAAQDASRARKALARMTSAACEIVIVRHGETQWNVEQRLQGQLQPGPPLTLAGEEQAAALASRLAEQQFDALWSSDLARTLQTADIIKEKGALGHLEIQIDAGLRERQLGALQGLTIADVRHTRPEEFAGLITHNDAAAAAGVESLDAMQARVAAALERIAAAHPGQRVLCLAHGGVLAAVHRRATGAPPPAKSSNCAINILKIDASQTPAAWAVVEWGDEAHLGGQAASFGGGEVG